jgi:hypothetical protein
MAIVTTLCNATLRVDIGGYGDRTFLQISDGDVRRFWCSTQAVREVLSGVALQVSADDAYCALQLQGDRVHVDYAVSGFPRQTCVFEAADLRAAIEVIERQQIPAEEAVNGPSVPSEEAQPPPDSSNPS